jgi:uncharacterized protein
VWDALSNPCTVVDCVPGGTLGDRLEDGSYDTTLTVKFGPARVTFRARVALELDGTTMIGRVILARQGRPGRYAGENGDDFQGRGGAAVPIDAQVEISGRLASLVESGATLVVKRMTGEFTDRFRALRQGDGVERSRTRTRCGILDATTCGQDLSSHIGD